MRKLLTNGLVIFAGVVSLPATVSNPAQPRPDYGKDPRLALLRNFFRDYDCPAVVYSEEFLKAADAHNLDWRLLPSITLIETGGGREARSNNLFGWDCGRAVFSSAPDAIHHVAFNLARSRLYRNKSLDRKLRTYNTDATYGARVKSVMRRLGSTPRLSASSPR
jgi:hypothetical protein